jgi:formate-dependent phosphoribosylglycinamide formyltransferase (GAR transformylase)
MTVGVLGAGQLGRMLALAGYPLGLDFLFLDAAPDTPAHQVAPSLFGKFTDASLLDESMGKVRAAVGAVALEQPETSALVFVEHEVLAQEANGLDRGVIELARAPDRHPIAAQQLAHRRARADLGEKTIFFRAEHA